MSEDRPNWLLRLGAVLVTGAAGFLAANQHWIDVSRWPLVGQLSAKASSKALFLQEPGLVPDPIDVEIPPELANAQSEPADDEEPESNAQLMEARDVEGVQSAGHEESAEAPPKKAQRSGYQRQANGGDGGTSREAGPPARVPIYPRGQAPKLGTSEQETDTAMEATPPRPIANRRPNRVQPVRAQETGEPSSPNAMRAVGSRPDGTKGPANTRSVSRPAEEEEPKPLVEIDSLIADRDYVTAQRDLSQWWFQRPESRPKIQARLNKLSQALYFASTPNFYEPYVIQPGDQLRQVGRKYQLSWEYLAKLNRTQPSRIRAGQKLKVVPGPFGVIASLSRFELTLHLSGSYVKHYQIGIGKDGSSPVGTFTVKNKQVDPTYFGPDGVVANDDPENPLGERWIDIGDSFGIHGTNEPDSIGKAESRGCLRLRHDDIVELYDFLVIGSEVRIEE